jgi:hypothetical protein
MTKEVKKWLAIFKLNGLEAKCDCGSTHTVTNCKEYKHSKRYLLIHVAAPNCDMLFDIKRGKAVFECSDNEENTAERIANYEKRRSLLKKK